MIIMESTKNNTIPMFSLFLWIHTVTIIIILQCGLSVVSFTMTHNSNSEIYFREPVISSNNNNNNNIPTTPHSPHESSAYISEVFDWFQSENLTEWNTITSPEIPAHNVMIHFTTETEVELFVNLVPTPRNLSESMANNPTLHKMWTSSFIQKNKKIVHLHQDIWVSKNEIVKARLLALLGKTSLLNTKTKKKTNSRIFARKTFVERINGDIAAKFLRENHLWGATGAKYSYGLFTKTTTAEDSDKKDTTTTTLVAVATFSAHRNIKRGPQKEKFRSHELLRYCSQRDTRVIGGISKLCSHFIKMHKPNDIVTCIDRDFGDGSGWHKMGFHTVDQMEPIVMAISQQQHTNHTNNNRRHLVGAGILPEEECLSTDNNKNNKKERRMGLPNETLKHLQTSESAQESFEILANASFYPLFDAGVERLIKIVSHPEDTDIIKDTKNILFNNSNSTAVCELYEQSTPKYTNDYYSSNQGITHMLKYASVLKIKKIDN